MFFILVSAVCIMYQTLSYNMSCGCDMGGGVMNVNANTKGCCKNKVGIMNEGK